MAWPVRHCWSRISRQVLGTCSLLTFALCSPSNVAEAAVFYPQTFKLANGMEVVVVQNRLSPAVAQMVWYKVGSIDDPKGRSGLAHYLEHMMFKGTKSVGDSAYSRIIAGMGGDENAFTTHNYTAYHVMVSAERLGDAMQLEADRMNNLVIDPKLAMSELAVVISERQQRIENTPQGLFAEKMAAIQFPDHLYGRPVIGWGEDLERITPDDAAAFYRTHYAPNNAVLVVSGNVEVSEVLRLASATFGRMPACNLAKRPDLRHVTIPNKKRLEMQDPRVTQPIVTWRKIVPTRIEKREESYALEVLVEALSADEVGLLYRHFVMDRKSAAGIDADYEPVSLGKSTFSVAATPVVGGDVRALEKEIKAYLQRLSQRGLQAKDVSAAKQRLEDSAVFARDRLMAPAEILGASMASGLGLDEVERWPQRIRSVTTEQVNAVLRAVISNQYDVTGILEPASSREGS